MTAKETAEAYVREKLPELKWEHPAGNEPQYDDLQLQHWLRVLGVVDSRGSKTVLFAGEEFSVFVSPNIVNFNLTTGQPATEEDYKAFNEIVGI